MADEAHFYYGFRNLGLTAGQWNTFLAWLYSCGSQNWPQPAHRNHWRMRLDGQAVILEGKFDLTQVSAAGAKNKLAEVFGVDPVNISINTASTAYGPAATFRYNSVSKLQGIQFADTQPPFGEGWTGATGYLADNLADWEPAV